MDGLERYQTGWRRFFAAILDGILLGAASGILHFLSGRDLGEFDLVQILYTVLLTWRWAGTPGKLVLNLNVVDHKTEQPISLKQSCLREIGTIVFLFLGISISLLSGRSLGATWDVTVHALNAASSMGASLWILVEILSMLTDPKRRAIHDRIAGTVVIKTELAGELL